MEQAHDSIITLDSIPADRRLVENLFCRKLISAAARNHAIELLYPSKNWGLWASRLLLVLGVALMLAGIVYLFAFNWAKIPASVKLGGIQIMLVGALAASWYFGLQSLKGKILLLAASMIVGVFLAVFGQIYQTGADAYNLFMVWALFILPWALIAEFAALWVLWLVVANVFALLVWEQALFPGHKTEMMIYAYLILFNGLVLALREYVAQRGLVWLQDRWTRIILVLYILILGQIPLLEWIFDMGKATVSEIIGAVVAVSVHAIFYYLYRHRFYDLWSLAATSLSACVAAEAICIKLILIEGSNSMLAGNLVFLGAVTIGIFMGAITMLRKAVREKGGRHV